MVKKKENFQNTKNITSNNLKLLQYFLEIVFVLYFLPPEFLLKLLGIITPNNSSDYKFFTETINILITIISLIIILISSKKIIFIFKKSRYLILVIFFCLVSYIWVNQDMKASSFNQVLILISSIIKCLAVVCIISINNLSYFKTLLNSILYVLFFNFIFILLYPNQVFNDFLTDRLQGLFSHPNSMGLFCGVANLVLFLSIYKTKNKKNNQVIILIITILFNNILLILSNSVTSLIASIISIIGLLFIKQQKLFLYISLLANILFFLYIITNDVNKYTQDSSINIIIKEYINRDVTITGRTSIWDLTLKNLYKKDKLLLGYGIGGFWGKEANTPSQKIDNSLVQNISSAHNGFLGITIEYGIIMLVIVVVMLYYFINTILKLKISKTILFFFTYTIFIFITNLTESNLFQFKNGYFNIFLVNIFITNILKTKK